MIMKQRFSERIGGHEKAKSELEAEIEKCKLAFGSAGSFGDGRDDSE
jgi:hypothetical protein